MRSICVQKVRHYSGNFYKREMPYKACRAYLSGAYGKILRYTVQQVYYINAMIYSILQQSKVAKCSKNIKKCR